jgi:tetratricopeptide (TPR) repeat protein
MRLSVHRGIYYNTPRAGRGILELMRWAGFVVLAVLSSSCAAEQAPPDAHPMQGVRLTPEEQTRDPLPGATQLIEQRETAGSLDHAIALLNWHVERHPESAELHRFLAEAHSRAVETLDLKKAADRPGHELHRTEGRRHAEEAVKLAPDNGDARYWLAALLLHVADAESSLTRAREALGHIEKADQLSPGIDQGGPARLRGKLLQDIPGILGGSLTKAITSYQRSIAISPGCITTHLWLAQAYLDAKKPDLARKELDWVGAAKARKGHEKEDGEDKQTALDLLKKLDAK